MTFKVPYLHNYFMTQKSKSRQIWYFTFFQKSLTNFFLTVQLATFTFYIYITFCGQKFIEKWSISRGFFLNNWSLRSNSVTRQVNFNRTKIGGKYQNPNATFCVILKHCAIPELQENRVFMLGHKGHVFLKEEKKKAQFHNFFSIF